MPSYVAEMKEAYASARSDVYILNTLELTYSVTAEKLLYIDFAGTIKPLMISEDFESGISSLSYTGIFTP